MSLQATLAALQSFAQGEIPQEVWQDEATRRKLIAAARLTTLKLESPWDTVQRISYLPLVLSAARVAEDLDIFRLLAERGDVPATNEDLAAATGAEPALLSRILVFLASHWMVEEVAENTYRATNITRNLAIPGIKAGIYHAAENCASPYHALPRFLASNNYKDVTDPTKSPFQMGQNTDLHLFGWMLSHPQNFGAFHEYMGAQRIGQPDWLDSFPLEQYCNVRDDRPKDKIAFVDIGGGAGHQCDMVVRKFPVLKGRVIVQDRPEVVALAKIEGVEPMAHDFLKEQPVKGAEAYYVRNIFHDYPTHVCRTILSAILPALGPHSVILIDDLVLPDTGAHWYATQLDLAMMSMLAAQERSVKEWSSMLDDVGLKMERMVRYTEHNDSVIVAVLKNAK